MKEKLKLTILQQGGVEEMTASATLDGYIINIVPNGASVNQFYSENVNVTENVGIVELAIIIPVYFWPRIERTSFSSPCTNS